MDNQPVRPRSNIPKLMVIVVIVTLILGLAYSVIYGIKHVADRSFDAADQVLGWPGKVARLVGGVFQTKVSITNNSFTLEEKDIMELAVVQRRIVCVTKYEKPGPFTGDAVAIIKGVYVIKAGYDLKQGYRIAFDEKGKVVDMKLPPPKILSNTTETQELWFVSQGLANKLTPQDLAEAYRQNLQQAKLEAHDMGMLKEAQARMQERLTDVLGDNVSKLNFSTKEK
jgi:hypothetical protein